MDNETRRAGSRQRNFLGEQALASQRMEAGGCVPNAEHFTIVVLGLSGVGSGTKNHVGVRVE